MRRTSFTPPRDPLDRLHDVAAWAAVAKENLPDINDARVSAGKVAAVSALVDRLYLAAVALAQEIEQGEVAAAGWVRVAA